jgi:predicted phosphate transport protein (TIGR00153 family)
VAHRPDRILESGAGLAVCCGLGREVAAEQEVPMPFSFGKTKALEIQVDQFLDAIIKGTLCMREAIASYLSGDDQDFARRLGELRDYEHDADDLRKSTETTLYTYSLIPESSADVLVLLDNLDDLIDHAKHIAEDFEVQSPDVEVGYLDQFIALTSRSVHAVEQAVEASRAFFRNEGRLRDCISKVEFYERQADQAGLRLKKTIYDSDMDLARKHHLRYFADQLESLSDLAEEVSDHLLITSIKRSA